MLVLAGSVAAGYLVIALVIAPRIRMPSASPPVVLLVRTAAMVFFVACGLTHLHIVAHTLGLGGRVRVVEGHDLVIHLAQALGSWLFIVGAALKLELHVVPADRSATQRDVARAQLAEQQMVSAALERRAVKASALARISEQGLTQRDLAALADDAATVVRDALPDCCILSVGSATGDRLLTVECDGEADDSDREFVRSANNLLANAVRRVQLEEELRRQSLHDPLTGLANRSLFTAQLERAWAHHRRAGRGLAVLAIDLDDLKTVNDRRGHHAGDALLVEAARRMQRCIRDSDTLARVGGDEYALVLPEAGVTHARDVAERLRRELAAPLVAAGEEAGIRASIGIVEVAERHHAPAELLREADTAMYAAKAAGKARAATYAPGMEHATSFTLPDVAPLDAIAWADYLRRLRLEFADRKLVGQIAGHSRSPAGMQRTLDAVLAAIDRLPGDATSATLVLPARRDLEEWVFHQTAVQHWADALLLRGTLTVSRTPAADRFWAHLERQATAAVH